MNDPTKILFTQQGCVESLRVRTWLAECGVPFGERNVTGNYDTAKELLATGIFAIPLLVIGATTVLGYRPEAIIAALRGDESATR
jgi:glutaredoxin